MLLGPLPGVHPEPARRFVLVRGHGVRTATAAAPISSRTPASSPLDINVGNAIGHEQGSGVGAANSSVPSKEPPCP